MDLDGILAQWATDCEIGHNLDVASRETPKLHGQYLGYYIQAKLLMKRAEDKQQTLLKNKFLWYNGKMSQDEIVDLGWEPDPFNGLKIMKGDLSYYYDSDPEIQQSEATVVYYKTMVEALKEIIDSLKWRHQTIGNSIRWKQFEAGA
jgi:hypothetical protein